MSNYSHENDSMPHKKAGKNQTATSPNRHGCEMNDFKEHNYVKFNHYTWSKMQDKFVTFGPLVICFDCKKRPSFKQINKIRKMDETYGDLMRYNDGHYYEVSFNKHMTRVISKVKFY